MRYIMNDRSHPITGIKNIATTHIAVISAFLSSAMYVYPHPGTRDNRNARATFFGPFSFSILRHSGQNVSLFPTYSNFLKHLEQYEYLDFTTPIKLAVLPSLSTCICSNLNTPYKTRLNITTKEDILKSNVHKKVYSRSFKLSLYFNLDRFSTKPIFLEMVTQSGIR
jgi:hypothetical protein